MITDTAIQFRTTDGTEGFDFSYWNRMDICDVVDDTPTVIEEED